MGVWTVLAILLGITGFYVFLSIYLVLHLLSGYLLREKAQEP